jgi:hypothetical protein
MNQKSNVKKLFLMIMRMHSSKIRGTPLYYKIMRMSSESVEIKTGAE